MKEFWQRFTANKRLAWELGLASFLISLLGLTSSIYSIQVLNRYLALGIDAPLKIGYDRARSKEGHGLVINRRIPAGGTHVLDVLGRFTQPLGLEQTRVE